MELYLRACPPLVWNHPLSAPTPRASPQRFGNSVLEYEWYEQKFFNLILKKLVILRADYSLKCSFNLFFSIIFHVMVVGLIFNLKNQDENQPNWKSTPDGNGKKLSRDEDASNLPPVPSICSCSCSCSFPFFIPFFLSCLSPSHLLLLLSGWKWGLLDSGPKQAWLTGYRQEGGRACDTVCNPSASCFWRTSRKPTTDCTMEHNCYQESPTVFSGAEFEVGIPRGMAFIAQS